MRIQYYQPSAPAVNQASEKHGSGFKMRFRVLFWFCFLNAIFGGCSSPDVCSVDKAVITLTDICETFEVCQSISSVDQLTIN